MAGHWTDMFSFLAGAVRTKELAYLAMIGDDEAEEKIASTHFVLWEPTEWFDCEDRPWNLAGITVAQGPKPQMVAVGEWGDVLCLGSGDTHDEHVAGDGKGPKDRGPLRGVQRIGSKIYVVGMDRQAYRRDGANRWANIGPKAPLHKGNSGTDVRGFEAVDGFDESDIYAVGWEGDIWHFDGRRWRALPSPTNLVLTAVCCAGDGQVYACGREGLLLKGRDESWEIVELPGTTQDLWSLAWFNDRLYVSSMYGLFSLGKSGLAIVNTKPEKAKTFHRVTVGDGRLLSIGAKDVLAFDGKTWVRID